MHKRLIIMKTLSYFLLFCLSVSAFSSCVSMRKYEDLEQRSNRLANDYRVSSEQLESTRAQAARLQERLGEAEKQQAQLTQDLAASKQRYDELDRTNRDLLARYDRILAQNEQMLQSAGNEKQQLTAQLAIKEQELDRREQELRLAQSRMETLQRDLEARSQRVTELENAIKEKEARLNSLREKVNAALRGFSSADLSVQEKNGRLYVSLSQNLLFPSGSKTINQQGKRAIAQLAQVLNSNSDINIMVEGHTDTDGDANFNWDLSVGRASTVVKELTANGVDPKRVTAAGRGEFFPIAPNTTTEGKAQNRRTEIILTPKLEALYELIGG